MYTYVCCQIFVLLATSLSVRSLFGETPRTGTHEARPDTLVQVSARSACTLERVTGARSFFSRRKWIRRFPWFLYERHYFVPGTYVSVNCRLSSSHQVHNSGPQIPSFQRCRPPAVRVRHTHIYAKYYCCGSLLYVGACRPYFTICLTRYHGTRFCFILFYVQTQAGVQYLVL